MKEEEIPIIGLLLRSRPDKQETVLLREHLPARRYGSKTEEEKSQKKVPVDHIQPRMDQQEVDKPVETKKHDTTMQSLFDLEV